MDSTAAAAQPRAASESNGVSTMGTKEKKPFTYTPGGIDLSEIKSETMAKRLIRNAMSPGVQETPKSPPNRSGSLPGSQPTHTYNLTSVQVLPNIQLPANPKSLLRQTSGPNGDSIDRILDVSIPFEIKNDKKANGSIIEGTPILKKNDDKETESEEDTATINQSIRRNSEKLESSVEEVIEKLKLSLEEANKNLGKVSQDNNKSTENDEDVSEEEELEEEEEIEEEEEAEEDVVETFTITRKTNTEETKQSDENSTKSESRISLEKSKSPSELAKMIPVDENSNLQINEKSEQISDEEVEEEEIEEEEEYEETNEIKQVHQSDKSTEKESDKIENKNDIDLNKNPSIKSVENNEVKKVGTSSIEKSPSYDSSTIISAQSVEGEKEDATDEVKEDKQNIEESGPEPEHCSSHSSRRASEDRKDTQIMDEVGSNVIREQNKSVENNQQVKNEEEHITEIKNIGVQDFQETEINNNQRSTSPCKKISETLGDLDNLPALDISPKRFSFLQEREETREEYTITSTHNNLSQTAPQVKTFTPVYKPSQIQAPAFERPVQKSYHPPPPQTVNRTYPHAQSYSQKPNYQSSYDKITNDNIPSYVQPQPIQNQFYSPSTHTSQYQQVTSQEPSQSTYHQVDYYLPPQCEPIRQQQSTDYYPYNIESTTSKIEKQVEILPPWENERPSQQPINYVYENTPAFYESSPIPKIQPPWKSSYSVPPETKSKPIINSTTGVLNPLVNSNKRNSWLQQTSIEQEFTDYLADTEPHWKRELREMTTKPNDYYSDEIEPKAEVEPPWRRELREFSQRNNPQPEEPKLEPQSVEPPWMKEVKYRLTTYSQPQAPTSWQTQTLRPKTWREKSADIERVKTNEPSDWQKTNTMNSKRPLSSYAKSYLDPNYLDTRTRGASVDRDRVSHSYQPPVNSGYTHVPSYNNGYTFPWEVSSNESPMLSPTPNVYDRTSTPQSSSSSYKQQQKAPYGYAPSQHNNTREYATLSYQPRRTTPSRSCPVQSRSFRYLQILTGTYDGYVDDEPFVPQQPLEAQPKPGPY